MFSCLCVSATTIIGYLGPAGPLSPNIFVYHFKKDGKSPKKLFFLIGFVLPCTVIIIAYSCIYYSVRKARDSLNSHQYVNKIRFFEK